MLSSFTKLSVNVFDRKSKEITPTCKIYQTKQFLTSTDYQIWLIQAYSFNFSFLLLILTFDRFSVGFGYIQIFLSN